MPQNREKGHAGKGETQLQVIAISAGIGIIAVLVLLAVFAMIMSAQDIPNGMAAPLVTLSLVAGTLLVTYILMSNILPKTVQLAAIILLCNTAQSDLKRLSGGENITQALLWVVGAILFAAGALLQTVMQIKLSSGIIA